MLSEDIDKNVYVIALNKLGVYYDNTFPKLSKECFKKTYKKGSLNGLYNYADLLAEAVIEGEGEYARFGIYKIDEKKRKKAYVLFKKYLEIRPNDADAHQSLAELEDSTDKKRDGYLKAFYLGNVFLFDWLLTIAYRRNREEAQKIADIAYDKIINEKSSKINSAQINRLAMFFNGFLEILDKEYNNQAKAKTLWKQSCEQNNMTAKLNLSLYYIGKRENWINVEEMLKECAENGMSLACEELGKIYSGMYGWFGCVRQDESKQYFKKGADMDDPSPYCCIKVAEALTDTHERSKYYLKTIKKYSENSEDYRPKTLTIPMDVICLWSEKMNTQIHELEKRIIELECRPPSDGGEEYLKAKERFSNHIKL